jgi:heme A synthase
MHFTPVQGLLGWYMVKSGLDHKNFEGKWINFVIFFKNTFDYALL